MHGDLPPFWAMDEFNQFMLDCETYYNNEAVLGRDARGRPVALAVEARFRREDVQFEMAPVGVPRRRRPRARVRGRQVRAGQRLAGAGDAQMSERTRTSGGAGGQTHHQGPPAAVLPADPAIDQLHGMVMAMATRWRCSTSASTPWTRRGRQGRDAARGFMKYAPDATAQAESASSGASASSPGSSTCIVRTWTTGWATNEANTRRSSRTSPDHARSRAPGGRRRTTPGAASPSSSPAATFAAAQLGFRSGRRAGFTRGDAGHGPQRRGRALRDRIDAMRAAGGDRRGRRPVARHAHAAAVLPDERLPAAVGRAAAAVAARPAAGRRGTTACVRPTTISRRCARCASGPRRSRRWNAPRSTCWRAMPTC